MDYAEIKNLMRDMENSSLDSIEIALPEGTKVKMRKSPIIYAGLNYDVTENSTSQGVNKDKNIDGEIVEICYNDEDLVEYGSVLFKIN